MDEELEVLAEAVTARVSAYVDDQLEQLRTELYDEETGQIAQIARAAVLAALTKALNGIFKDQPAPGPLTP